jgi:glycolate oxidase
VGRISPDFLVQDRVVPRRRLGEALRRIVEMSQEAGLRCANVFHAGDGNLHPLILFDGRQPGALERAEALAGRILTMCVEMGGSLTGEHGIGVDKRGFLPDMFGAGNRMHETDPRRVRSAGHRESRKMFPGTGAPALTRTGLHPLERAGVISRE